MGSPFVTTVVRDLEERLQRRRGLESQGHDLKAHSTNFLIRHERVVRAVIRTALRGTGLYARGVANALRPEMRHIRVEFPNLPAGLEGFRILHLSDFHIDGVDGLAEILAERLSLLPVDLCVLTGDYRFEVHGSCKRVYPRMRLVIDAIRARHGICGVLGNHDCADIAVELEKMGVQMLLNEATQIGPPEHRLWLMGIDDPFLYQCDDLEAARQAVPDDSFKVLLAHTPELFSEAGRAGIHLYLSGHTHAGQIRLPWIGPVVVHADCPKQFTGGPWDFGLMKGYTSAGVGCSMLPIRFGCPPEIVVFELGSTG